MTLCASYGCTEYASVYVLTRRSPTSSSYMTSHAPPSSSADGVRRTSSSASDVTDADRTYVPYCVRHSLVVRAGARVTTLEAFG